MQSRRYVWLASRTTVEQFCALLSSYAAVESGPRMMVGRSHSSPAASANRCTTAGTNLHLIHHFNDLTAFGASTTCSFPPTGQPRETRLGVAEIMLSSTRIHACGNPRAERIHYCCSIVECGPLRSALCLYHVSTPGEMQQGC